MNGRARSQRAALHPVEEEGPAAPARAASLRPAHCRHAIPPVNAFGFDRIYQQYNERVYRLCLRMAGNSAEAEDLTQEAFLHLFRKIHTYRGESAFYTWLYRLVVNVVLMRFRRKVLPQGPWEEVVRLHEMSGKPRTGTPPPALSHLSLIDRVSLRRAIDQLPPGFKSEIILHDIEGYEHREIAELLGRTVGTSKSQLHKARNRLRELLLGTGNDKPGKRQAATLS